MTLAFPNIFLLWRGLEMVAVSGSVSSSVSKRDKDGDGTGRYRRILGDDLPNTEDNTSGTNAAAAPSNDRWNKTITPTNGCTLAYIFLLLPPLVHLLVFYQRLFPHSSRISPSHVAHLTLVVALTFGRHFAMVSRGWI